MYLYELPTNIVVDIEIQTTFSRERYQVPILNDSFDCYEKHMLTIDLGSEGNQLIVEPIPMMQTDGVITIYANIENRLYAWQNVNLIMRTLNDKTYVVLYSEENSFYGNRRVNERFRIHCKAIAEINDENILVTIYDVSETGISFEIEDATTYESIRINDLILIQVSDIEKDIALRVGFKQNKRCVFIVRKFIVDGHYIAAGTFI